MMPSARHPEGDADQELDVELLTRVCALFRTGRSYSVGNRLFVQQLEALVETATQLLRERGEFLFAAYGGEVFLNGRRVASTGHGFRMAKNLVTAFTERSIAGFEVRGEPDLAEWRAFFELLMNRELVSAPAWDAAAEERGLQRIALVRAVFEEPVGDGGGTDEAESDSASAPETRDREPERTADAAQRRGALGGQVSPECAAALGAAPKNFRAALDGLTSLVTSTSAQRGVELRHARRVIQPLVDSAMSRDPVVLGLAGLLRRDEYTYARLVNACMIATTIGQRLGFERTELSTLAVAALLHGIGRAETTDVARIGSQGALLLARRGTLQELTIQVMRVAYEAGAGPAPVGRSSVLSQIVGISAMYSRLVSARGDSGKSTTPTQALGMIVGPLTGGFDPALKVALIESLGFHPPGQFVELDDGTIALVIAPNRTDLDRPIVQPCFGRGGRPLEAALDRAGGILPPQRSILRDLHSSEIPDPQAQDLRAA
jgi:HD-GYP domain-containing protein (c-di-GMP phosphodiesterase class II)